MESGQLRGLAEVTGISQTQPCFLSCIKGSNCGENPDLLVKQTAAELEGAAGSAAGHGVSQSLALLWAQGISWVSPNCAVLSVGMGWGREWGWTTPCCFPIWRARGACRMLSPCPAGNGSKANALTHGEMVSLDESSFPALELNNRRLSVKNSFCRKNGIYTR